MGSSVSVDRENGKVKDVESLAAVQKFTELAYDVSPKNETLRVILTNSAGRKAFTEFLYSEVKLGPTVGVNFFETKRSVRAHNTTLRNQEIPPEQPIDIADSILAQNLISDYQMPAVETNVTNEQVSSMSDHISQLLSGHRDFSNDEILNILDSAGNETILLLAIEALPRFIASKYFKDWQAVESARAIAVTTNASEVNVTIPEILAADPALIETPIVPTEASFATRASNAQIITDPVMSLLGGATSSKKYAASSSVRDESLVEATAVSGPPKDDVVENALKNVDYLEIDRILRSGSWLFTFVAAVENLPICITLSTARKDRIGFPLIYVNRFFEATSGYSRTDIMGANCKFLQRDGSGVIRSESDSVERLSNALKNAEPIKVAITNFRRDGTPFKNLLAIKPVFDTKGEYEYVIGVQFDISSQRSSSYALRLVDALVKLLPSVVVY